MQVELWLLFIAQTQHAQGELLAHIAEKIDHQNDPAIRKAVADMKVHNDKLKAALAAQPAAAS